MALDREGHDGIMPGSFNTLPSRVTDGGRHLMAVAG
jgi:hypothetical protein